MSGIRDMEHIIESQQARIRELEIERQRILEQRILNVEDLEQRIARAREILKEIENSGIENIDVMTRAALDALEGK